MAYMTGKIQSMPRSGRRGTILGDDGTLFTFVLPVKPKARLTVGGRVLFVAGAKNSARGVRLGMASHSSVGQP